MKKSSKQGQALVEFAIILPLLILLLMSFFDVGIHFFVRLSVDKALQSALCSAGRTGGEDAFSAAALSELVDARAFGVEIGEKDLHVTISDCPGRKAWKRLRVVLRFSKPTVTGMYLTKMNDLEQVIVHERILPKEVLLGD